MALRHFLASPNLLLRIQKIGYKYENSEKQASSILPGPSFPFLQQFLPPPDQRSWGAKTFGIISLAPSSIQQNANRASAEGNEMLIKSLHPGHLLVLLIWVMYLYTQSRNSESGDTRWGNCQNHFQKNSSRFGVWVGCGEEGQGDLLYSEEHPAPQSATHGDLKPQKSQKPRCFTVTFIFVRKKVKRKGGKERNE